MSIVFDETFDNGADATVADETTTEYTASSAHNALFDTSTVLHGAASCKLVNSPGATPTLDFNHGILSLVRERFYFRLGADPAGDAALWHQLTGGGTVVAALEVQASGGAQILNGATQVGTQATAVPVGEWVRCEVRVDGSGAGGSHSIEARLYYGADLENAYADYTEQMLATGLTLPSTSMAVSRIGKIDSDPVDWWIDEHRIVNSDDDIGPHVRVAHKIAYNGGWRDMEDRIASAGAWA